MHAKKHKQSNLYLKRFHFLKLLTLNFYEFMQEIHASESKLMSLAAWYLIVKKNPWIYLTKLL